MVQNDDEYHEEQDGQKNNSNQPGVLIKTIPTEEFYMENFENIGKCIVNGFIQVSKTLSTIVAFQIFGVKFYNNKIIYLS